MYNNRIILYANLFLRQHLKVRELKSSVIEHWKFVNGEKVRQNFGWIFFENILIKAEIKTGPTIGSVEWKTIVTADH